MADDKQDEERQRKQKQKQRRLQKEAYEQGAVPAGESTFKAMLEDGVTGEQIIAQTAEAFQETIHALMKVIPQGSIDVPHRWGLIALATVLDGLGHTLAPAGPAVVKMNADEVVKLLHQLGLNPDDAGIEVTPEMAERLRQMKPVN